MRVLPLPVIERTGLSRRRTCTFRPRVPRFWILGLWEFMEVETGSGPGAQSLGKSHGNSGENRLGGRGSRLWNVRPGVAPPSLMQEWAWDWEPGPWPSPCCPQLCSAGPQPLFPMGCPHPHSCWSTACGPAVPGCLGEAGNCAEGSWVLAGLFLTLCWTDSLSLTGTVILLT